MYPHRHAMVAPSLRAACRLPASRFQLAGHAASAAAGIIPAAAMIVQSVGHGLGVGI